MDPTTDPHNPKPVTGYPATAYPYPAPPPYSYYQNPNPNPNPNGNYPNPNQDPNPSPYNRNRFLRRVLIGAVAALLVVGAATFVLYLILRPRLPEFAVSSLRASSFNLSSNSLSSQFDLQLLVRNPNSKMSISYDDVTAAVLYDGVAVAEAAVDPFWQRTGDLAEVKAGMAASGEHVDDDVAEGMRRDLGSRNVRLGVRVLGAVRFESRARAWRTRRHSLRVFCDGIVVVVGFKNSTTTTGTRTGSMMVGTEARQCHVEL